MTALRSDWIENIRQAIIGPHDGVLRDAHRLVHEALPAGHGMGLEYHEPPFVETADDTPLEPGMVLTIEPGIWIPGRAGLC
jgi:Xaa-Pro dipeptidase